jgi:hypothetical protein
VAKGADASDAQADVTEKHEAEVDAVAPPKDTGPHLPDGYAFDGPVFTVEAGVTWSSLYRDYFGPTGVASCEKEGFCHGTTSGVGYQTSSFLCPTGDGGVTTCWQTMTAADGGYLVTPDAGESFADSNLGAILCYPANPGGRMPTNGDETCAYYFTASDIQRISDWIATGALDN